MSNKYLEKIADYIDNAEDESRRYIADDMNRVLKKHGYRPSIDSNPSGYAQGQILKEEYAKSWDKPHSVKILRDSLGKGALTGLGTGLLAYSASKKMSLPLNKVIGVTTGLGVGTLASKLLYKHNYTENMRKEDNETDAKAKQNFQKFLDKHYTKL